MGSEEKNKSGRFKRLKKFSNTLWFAGTISALLFIVISVILLLRSNHKNNAKDTIMDNLRQYNAVHFGYQPEIEEDTPGISVVADVSSELMDMLEALEAESVDILDAYNQVSVRIREPEDDIYTIATELSQYADYWQIVDNGVIYHGTPDEVLTEESDLEIQLSEAENVDIFLANMDNAIISNTDSIILFGDVNYGKVVLTDSLCEAIRPVIEDNEIDSLLLKLQLLDSLGEYTPEMNNLYDLYDQVRKG